MEKIGEKDGEKEKIGEKENKGLPTTIKYLITPEVQKKLAEQGKYAGSEQEAYIRITDEELKKHVNITREGAAHLGLIHKWAQRLVGLGRFEIRWRSEYPKTDDESSGRVYRKVYYIDSDTYYFDKVIESEQDILDAIAKCKSQYEKLSKKVEELQKEADEDYERRRQEYIENIKKKEEEARRKAEEEKQRLLSKSWVKKLVDITDIENIRKAEIERFKKKFELSDDEIRKWDVSNKPYVHLEAEVNLRPLNISRTIIIRNYMPDNYVSTNESYDGFSDLSNNIAQKLAEIFNGEVNIYGNDEDCPTQVYLAVISDSDVLEIASIYIDYDC